MSFKRSRASQYVDMEAQEATAEEDYLAEAMEGVGLDSKYDEDGVEGEDITGEDLGEEAMEDEQLPHPGAWFVPPAQAPPAQAPHAQAPLNQAGDQELVVATRDPLSIVDNAMLQRHNHGLRILQRQHTQLGEILAQVHSVEQFGRRPTPRFPVPKKASGARAKWNSENIAREKELEQFIEYIGKACEFIDKASHLAHRIAGRNNAIHFLETLVDELVADEEFAKEAKKRATARKRKNEY